MTTRRMAPPVPPSFGEAARVWARIGLLSFGGPAAQIALMHRELVEERRWVDEERFLHALNYCMLLPGPEAQQLATYLGWLMFRARGGLVAGLLFIAPGVVTVLALSALYAVFQGTSAVEALFFGLKAAVLGVVIEAVARIGRRALRSPAMWVIATSSFVAMFAFQAPFPLVILGAGAFGLLAGGALTSVFPQSHSGATVVDESVIGQLAARGALGHTQPSSARTARTLVTWLAIWVAPVIVLVATAGPTSIFVRQARFFSQAAMVTFGGGYAVLSYIAQRAVEDFAWLSPGQMLDGLALAETTPGPLILVVQFVGFLGAYNTPGDLPPLAAGLIGGLVTVWVTFAPCFLWIFVGAPYIETMRSYRRIQAALSAITAAVVGVILNLSVWFALHVVFARVRMRDLGLVTLPVPSWSRVDVVALVLAAAATVALVRFKASLPKTLAACALLGAASRLGG